MSILTAVAGFLAAICCLPAFSLDLDQKVDFNIPAQELSAALIQFSQQADVQIVVSGDIRGQMSQGVSGEHAIKQALSRLLGPAGLSYRVASDTSITVGRAESIVGVGERVRVAQGDVASGAEGTSTRGEGSGDNDDSAAAVANEDEEDSERGGIPEILVTGSKLGSLNADIRRDRDGPQPYVIFDRTDIEHSGAVTLEGFLSSRLTAATNSMSNSQVSTTPRGSTSRINLRGLGADETLILIDGRRVAGFAMEGAFNQPDVNSIPIGAVERIEILPTTASGIYGGGATGGVVNIILRHDYSGVEVKLTYGNTFDADAMSKKIDVSSGFNVFGGKTNILLTGTFSNTGSLLVQDRNFAKRARAHILAENPDFFFNDRTPPLGATTNIRSANGQDLTLKSGLGSLESPLTFVPYGYAGPSIDGGLRLLDNAGQYNLDIAAVSAQGGARQSLLNTPTVKSFVSSVRHQFTPSLGAFSEVAASRNDGSFITGVQGIFDIPANVPGNPFNEAIRVTTPVFGVEQLIESKLSTHRAAMGVALQLPNSWSFGSDYTWNRSQFSSTLPGLLRSAAATAAVGLGELNVFRDTNTSPPDFSPFLLDRRTFAPADSILKSATLRLGGPIGVKLPGGGMPTMSVSVEGRKEKIGSSHVISTSTSNFTTRNLYPSQSQDINSIYLETLLPVLMGRNATFGSHELELRLAVRYDQYKIDAAQPVVVDENLIPLLAIQRGEREFDSIDPMIALRYQPMTGLSVRGSYGTGFRPPALTQIVPAFLPFTDPGVFYSSFLTDPRRGGEPIGALNDITITAAGSGSIGPEQSETKSLGIIFKPNTLNNLRLSVDWTRIDKKDAITTPFDFSQSSINNEDFIPNLIVRAPIPDGDPFPVGPVSGFNFGYFNIARIGVEALDYAIDFAYETQGFGSFELNLGATNLLTLDAQLTPVSPNVDFMGVGSAGNVGDAADGGGLEWKGVRLF